MLKLGLMNESELDQFQKLCDAVEAHKEKLEQEEAVVYSDAPDEFLDALLFTLMKDPVKLPSRLVVLVVVVVVVVVVLMLEMLTRTSSFVLQW